MSDSAAGWSSLRNYAFIDYATQIYIAVVAALILLLHNHTVPEWPWLLGAHAAALVINHALIRGYDRWPQNPVLNFLRHFYPVLLYTGFYRETGALNRMVFDGYLDPIILRGEFAIFRCQPALAFMQALPYLPLSELLYTAYFSYYVMIAGVGIALFRRNRRQFFHYISVASFVFYVCYLIYIFVPVMGPRIFYRELENYELPADVQPASVPSFPENLQVGPVFRLMGWIYHTFEAPGAAFPSSHVAIALCTVYFSFLYLRRIRWVHLTLAMLLCVSTIYGRYHYVVDVIAGALTAAVLVPLGNRLYWRFAGSRGSKSVSQRRA